MDSREGIGFLKVGIARRTNSVRVDLGRDRIERAKLD